jgi:hypothetical protein
MSSVPSQYSVSSVPSQYSVSSVPSLQILSILSLENLNELKKILIPKKYFSMSYTTSDFPHIETFVSPNLYEDEQELANNLVQVIRSLQKEYNVENIYCSTCDLTHGEKNWSDSQIQVHFLETKHFEFLYLIYRIKEYTTH